MIFIPFVFLQATALINLQIYQLDILMVKIPEFKYCAAKVLEINN